MTNVSPVGVGHSPVHRIVTVFGQALKDLGKTVSSLDAERWAIDVHHALAGRAREFHTHEHILDLVRDADPLDVLAAIYHDVVYVQVDLGLPARLEALLAGVLDREPGGWRITAGCDSDEVIADVLTVFGREAGEAVTPMAGLNELASALVAARQLAKVLTRVERLCLVTAIEATIPFRPSLGPPLFERVSKMGVAEPELSTIVKRAVRFANRDVGNFAETDPARFLDNTWKLLPETNPALNTPAAYTVSEYRVALQKMHGFLASLDALRVFHEWGGEPEQWDHARMVDAARRNILLAVRYLGAKLYSTAIIEALAIETGGDVPIDYFMGGLSDNGDDFRRAEQFLPDVVDAPGIDRTLLRLLERGRPAVSRFDTAKSPLATYLLRLLGEEQMVRGLKRAQAWWKGAGTANGFLLGEPTSAIAAVARATSNVAETRREALQDLADDFDERTSPALS